MKNDSHQHGKPVQWINFPVGTSGPEQPVKIGIHQQRQAYSEPLSDFGFLEQEKQQVYA